MVLTALELLAGQTWFGPYFRFGLPVFHQSGRLAPGADVPDAPRIAPQPGLPRIYFKTLTPAAQPTRIIAFREALFDSGRSAPAEPPAASDPAPGGPTHAEPPADPTAVTRPASVRYLPVMHSAARLDPAQGRVTVTGYLNWYLVFTLIYIVIQTLADPSFLFVAVCVVVIFGLSYTAQWSMNQAVLRAFEQSRR